MPYQLEAVPGKKLKERTKEDKDRGEKPNPFALKNECIQLVPDNRKDGSH